MSSQHPLTPRSHRLRRGLLGVFLLLSVCTSTAVVVAPTPALAVGPSSTVIDVPRFISEIQNRFLQSFVAAGYLGIKNGLRVILNKVAYDTAVWIGSGDNNQKPLLFTEDAGLYIQEVGDAAIGEALNTLAEQNGLLEFNLCDLPSLDELTINLLLPRLVGEPYEADCTFAEIKKSLGDTGNPQDWYQSFKDDPNAFINFSAQYDDGNNTISSMLSVADQAIQKKTDAVLEGQIEREKSDFKDVKDPVSGYIQTPAFFLEAQTNAVYNNQFQAETQFTGSLIADTLQVFSKTLSSKLLERAVAGILDFVTDGDISDSLAGDSSTTGAGGGVAGAAEHYATFQEPSFVSGSQIDILTDFATCPDAGATETNCIIDESFRLAISEGLTLQQAIDQGIIDPATKFAFDNGGEVTDPSSGAISHSGIKVLRAYSVVPVGWELAADFNNQFDSRRQLTIGELITNYSLCDAENYSPYCGLVDPQWVLKAPPVYCNVEGYSETILSGIFVDTDGSENTPEQLQLARQRTCVDPRSCLSEDDDGNCLAYGYCTEQKDTFRFEGESCNRYEVGCTTYTNSDGQSKSLLASTINHADCSEDNAGCQWRCTAYNENQGEFQCASQTTVYSTCDNEDGCSCETSGESCTVQNGWFSCTTGSNYTCTLPEVDATSEVDQATITFDNDITTCAEEDAGCREFIPVAGGANLLMNGSFEQFNGYDLLATDLAQVDTAAATDSADITDTTTAYDDTFGYTAAGEPCDTHNAPDDCYGWGDHNEVRIRAIKNTADGSVAMQIQDQLLETTEPEFVANRLDTGQALANRSFVLQFNYKNPNDGCSAQYWIAPKAGFSNESSSYAITQQYLGSDEVSSYQSVTSPTVTFGPDVSETVIEVGFEAPQGCNIALDAMTLEENSTVSGYSRYAASQSLTYINPGNTSSCTPEEVGCQLYTPQTGESSTAIPGKITNPLSAACGDGDDFSANSCSQCTAETVGCDSYIEVGTPYNTPINDITDLAPTYSPTDAEAAAIAARTGYYCDGTGTSCNPSIGCSDGSACLPEISIIPDTADSCSAANVGCEEYVNIDEQALGGEGLEYYTFIQQCVKPTTAQQDNGEIAVFYTFEGSEVSGVQLRAQTLKKSDVDDGPCTHLDTYGYTSSSGTPEAKCVDAELGIEDCSADYGTDPNCREFYSQAGDTYYRPQTSVIEVSDACVGLRNATDGFVYHGIREESTSCPASANQCREYQGSAGSTASLIVNDDFNDGPWDNGVTGSDVIVDTLGSSMQFGTSVGGGTPVLSLTGSLDTTTSYVVSFWAKRDSAASGNIYPYLYDGSNQNYFDAAGIALTDDWQIYTYGPIVLDSITGDNQHIGISFDSGITSAFVDNLELRASGSHYLIKGTADLCHGFEGCEEYTSSNGDTEYLKSFESLCNETVVGCEALINTQNSNSPFTHTYNTDNEFAVDDVTVLTDTVQIVVVTDESLCTEQAAACQVTGYPDLDVNDAPTSYTKQFLINDPDNYSTSLCQEQSRYCEAWTTDGGTDYFKDPADKTCTYDTTQGWITSTGEACPLQNENVASDQTQPKGAVCNGGARSGDLCSADADCPADSGDTAQYRCVSNDSIEYGWTGTCADSAAGCSLYVDPNTENLIENGNFETDAIDNTFISNRTPDGIPDNWDVEADKSYFTEAALGSSASTGCLTKELVDNPVAEGTTALKLAKGSSTVANCVFTPDELIPVDINAEYALSGYVYVDDQNSQFAIGFDYFNINQQLIAQVGDPERYAIAAYEGRDRTASGTSVEANKWMRFYSLIGPNHDREFSSSTYYVRPFIETAGGSTTGAVYFDDIRLVKSDEYSYDKDTVDVASCNGVIDPINGCVAFRDVTNSQLNSIADAAVYSTARGGDTSLTTCSLDSGIASEDCRSRLNAADTNTVISVRRDRQCAEWLTCTSQIYDTNENGDYEAIGCADLGRCTELDLATGSCSNLVSEPSFDDVGHDDDVLAINSSTDNSDLEGIQHASGWARVGMQWTDYEVDGTCEAASSGGFNKSCQGGYFDNITCTDDSDCAGIRAVVAGYYPFELITQVGTGSEHAVTDLVTDGNFEQRSCSGQPNYDTLEYGANAVESSRNRTLHCTADEQCRTNETDAAMESALASAQAASTTDTTDIAVNVDDTNYWEGWCQTSSDASNWYPYLTASAEVIDYDPDLINQIADDGTDVSKLDLDNALTVTPQNNSVSGAYTPLSESVQQGEDYVVSFRAAFTQEPNSDTDFIQVGLTHGAFNSDDKDYFATGKPLADVVFIIDASESMEQYIHDTVTSLSSLVDGLSSADLQEVRYSIVTTAGYTPAILDFDDYSSDPIGTNFGATNGVTSSYTTDPNLVSSALNTIAGNLQRGNVRTYDALLQVARNSFDGGNELNFQSGSQRFAVLLTDTAPEAFDTHVTGTTGYQEGDENDMIQALDGDPYILYSIIPTDGDTAAEKAFTPITEHLGGEVYSITASSYDDTLTSISNSIDDNTDPFSFDTTMRQYSLGPIKIENRPDNAGAGTNLFITQIDGSSNKPFVIDDVNIKPAVEVSKENNPASPVSNWVIGRTCRAYPEESSEQCDYIATNGIIYSGWKGYCLEADPRDADRCIAWWPVDVILGEGLIGAGTRVTYGGEAPAYHCLVSKGNADVTACVSADEGSGNEGNSCSDDSQCGTDAVCLGLNDSGFTYDDSLPSGTIVSSAGFTLGSDFESGIGSTYSIKTKTGLGTTEYKTSPLSHLYVTENYMAQHWLYSVSNDLRNPGVDGNDEYATFLKVSGKFLAMEKRFHISEIRNLKFYLGTPEHASVTVAEDEVDDLDASWGYGLSMPFFGSFDAPISTADIADQTVNGGYDSAFYAQTGTDTGALEGDDATWAIQAGIWCGDGDFTGANDGTHICTEEEINSDSDTMANADIIVVQGVAPASDDKNLLNSGRMYNDGEAFNPFYSHDRLGDAAGLWDKGGEIIEQSSRDGYEIHDTNWPESDSGGAEIENYWYSRHSDSDAEADSKCHTHDTCGANIRALKLDFVNGYLSDAYYILFNGMRRYDLAYMNGVMWEFDLSEPCLLAVQSADQAASQVKPWQTRINSSSDFRTDSARFTFTSTDSTVSGHSRTSYGAIGYKSLGDGELTSLDGWDPTIVAGDLRSFTSAGTTDLPQMAPEDGVGNGLPYSCIGDCDKIVCAADDYADYSPTTACGEDDTNALVGVGGTCVGTIEGKAVFCDDRTDCEAVGFTGTETGCNQPPGITADVSDGSSYMEQLRAAAKLGWERFRLLYADAIGTEGNSLDVYFAAPIGSTNGGSFTKADFSSDFASAFVNDFESMGVCSEDRDDSDYCGIRPFVGGITVNGIKQGEVVLNSGDLVTLNFDSQVDPDQEPMTDIRIDWDVTEEQTNSPFPADGDDFFTLAWDAASESGHYITKNYTCDGQSPNFLSGEGFGYCAYYIKIQVEDNWGFCSGDVNTSSSILRNPQITGQDSTRSTCTTYNQYNGVIKVYP